jgi:hypothetical protein
MALIPRTTRKKKKIKSSNFMFLRTFLYRTSSYKQKSHSKCSNIMPSPLSFTVLKCPRTYTRYGGWCTPVIPALRKLRKENYSLRPAWATKWNPGSKTKQNKSLRSFRIFMILNMSYWTFCFIFYESILFNKWLLKCTSKLDLIPILCSQV